MISRPPGYIVVEGPIGVGKTTLAERLAEALGSALLLERAEKNPFLERFYADPRRAALPTQLYFLFQRSRQIEQLRQGDLFAPNCVADFLLAKDRLFAEATLDADELHLYEQVYDKVALTPPAPDLVIYLQAPVEVLLRRVQRRGRAIEAGIDAAYLQRLSDAYTRFFYYYDASPLLIVNASEIDLASGDADFRALLAQVQAARSGRHYFNPLPVDL